MKNLLCREEYYKSLVNSRGCKYSSENCRGAHTEDEIRLYPHIKKFNEIDKKSYDWYKLYCIIKETIISEKFKVKNDEHKKIIDNIDNYNFIELINIWHDFACYYRKISKTDITIPQFDLRELEDDGWAFDRITRLCKTYNNQKSINQSLLTPNDLCLGSNNCKEGVHNISDLLCKLDFLTGMCPCIKLDEYILMEKELHNRFEIKAKEILTTKNFIEKYKMKQELSIIYNSIIKLRNSRMLHFSDTGMIPFNLIISNQIMKIEEIKEKKIIKLKLGKK